MDQYRFDIGVLTKCPVCGTDNEFYLDTHGVTDNIMVGKCTTCSRTLSAKFHTKARPIIYERGNIPYDIQQTNNRDDNKRGGGDESC